MKKMTKKVVIATSAGLASMILNAACGYGPPVEDQYIEPDSSYEMSTQESGAEDSIEDVNSSVDSSSAPSSASSSASSESTNDSAASESSAAEGTNATLEEASGDASGAFYSGDDYKVDPDDLPSSYNIEPIPTVYGPPTVDG